MLVCNIVALEQENYGGNSRPARGQERLVGLEHRLRELDGIGNTQHGRAVHNRGDEAEVPVEGAVDQHIDHRVVGAGCHLRDNQGVIEHHRADAKDALSEPFFRRR